MTEPTPTPNNPLLEHLSQDDLLLQAEVAILAADGTQIAKVRLNTPLPAMLEVENATAGAHQFNKALDSLLVRPLQMKVGKYIMKQVKSARSAAGDSGDFDSADGDYSLPTPPPPGS